MELWQAGQYMPMLYSYRTVESEARERLVLRPE
jgi:hypothetical protein